MKKSIILIALVSISLVGLISAINLTIHNPIEGKNYNSRSILFDLESNEPGDFFVTRFIFRPEGWRKLCRNTKICKKKVTLKEGENSVLIKVSNDGTESTPKPISFFIDTRVPRISSIKPRRNSVTNGNMFSVKYTENNLERITLFYKSGDMMESIFKDSTNCPSGRNMVCVFENVDLSDFDDQKIDFWFEAEDIAGNIDTSRPTRVTVDTVDPIVHNFLHQINRRRVNFVFEIEDDNFHRVLYMDNSDINPKWKTLCSRIKDGRCNARKSFRSGSHSLDIDVVDKAGNSVNVVEDLIINI